MEHTIGTTSIERSCQRHPDAAVIVPLHSNAVPSATAEGAPTVRDRHLQLIAERGRMGWQRASGYNWRALVEADIGRYKRVIALTDRRAADHRGGHCCRLAEPHAGAWVAAVRSPHMRLGITNLTIDHPGAWFTR
jgi:hypothetical protein